MRRRSLLLLGLLLLGGWHYPHRVAFDERSYRYFLAQVQAEPFHDQRLELVHTAAQSYWFTCDQLVGVFPLLEWKEDRLRAVEIVAPFIVDRQNVKCVLEKFDRDDRKRICAAFAIPET